MEKSTVKDIMLGQFEDNKFLRYDILVKYLFIEKYYENNKPDYFHFRMYDKLYIAKGTSKKHIRWEYDLFTILIDSFELFGFRGEYPISMTKDYHMCGGSHRIALSIWHDIPSVPVVFDDKCVNDRKRKHSRGWMKRHGFSKKMDVLDATKKTVFSKLGINK